MFIIIELKDGTALQLEAEVPCTADDVADLFVSDSDQVDGNPENLH